MSLGTLRPGQTAEATLTVRNTGDDVVIVERIETSCPCLEVGPTPIEIEPGEAKHLKVRFSSEEEPDFHGGLLVEVRGLSLEGIPSLTTHVKLTVTE